MALNGIEAVADSSGSQGDDTTEIGQPCNEASIHRAGQQHTVTGFHSRGEEARGIRVGKPRKVVLGVCDLAWHASGSAGEAQIRNLLAGHCDEVLSEVREVALVRNGEVL